MDQATLLTTPAISAFAAALNWLVDAALGSIAIVVLAVAGIGFLFLTGASRLRSPTR